MSDENARWLSVHIDIEHSGRGWPECYGPPADAVIDELVRPVVHQLANDGAVRRFFFIRYLDPQAHIRLRLSAPHDTHRHLVSVIEGARNHFNRAQAGAVSIERLREVSYEPEYGRYGGPQGVAISEAMFEASSRLVMDTLPVVRSQDVGLRFGHGAMGILLLIATVLRSQSLEERTDFLDRYERGRLHVEREASMRQQLAQLASGEERLTQSLAEVYGSGTQPDRLPDPLAAAARAFLDVQEALCVAWASKPLRFRGSASASLSQGLTNLAISYVHMHLNRLGIPTIREALACRIARQAVELVGEVAPST